jgi:hypothetical protein
MSAPARQSSLDQQFFASKSFINAINAATRSIEQFWDVVLITELIRQG